MADGSRECAPDDRLGVLRRIGGDRRITLPKSADRLSSKSCDGDLAHFGIREIFNLRSRKLLPDPPGNCNTFLIQSLVHDLINKLMVVGSFMFEQPLLDSSDQIGRESDFTRI